jgi:hypothetical protein
MNKVALAIILGLVSFAVFAGTRTIEEVRQSTKYPGITVAVSESYQAVYRSLKRELERCYNHGALSANSKVDGELYTDIQQGELGIGLYGALTRIYMIFDVSGQQDEATEVTIKTSYKAWRRHMPKMSDFIQTGAPICK